MHDIEVCVFFFLFFFAIMSFKGTPQRLRTELEALPKVFSLFCHRVEIAVDDEEPHSILVSQGS